MAPVETGKQERIARHEASHLAAATLLNRPIGGGWLNIDGGAGSLVGLVKDDIGITLEECLGDLVVLLVAGIVDGAPAGGYILEEAGSDEDKALNTALRVSNGPEEARATIALARARARSVAERRDFVGLVDVYATALMTFGRLNADQVHELTDIYYKENDSGTTDQAAD